ncbi:MAG: PAS domain S-box protein [Gammaproteobacteria bacterium]
MHSTELSFVSFAENTQDGILVICGQRLVYANHGIEEIIGYSPAELAGLTLGQIIAPDHSQPKASMLNGSGELPTGQYEIYFRRKDKSPCPVEITAAHGQWRDKPALILIVRDISARQRIESQLREIETRFLQITQNIEEVFFVRDLRNNEMIYISPAYEKIWQRPVSEIYENPLAFVKYIHPADRPRIEDIILARNLSRQGFSTYQYRIILPDGGVRCIRARTFPVMDETGRAYRVAGIAEDVTAERLAEEKLRFSEMQLRQIIDLVPHSIFVKDFAGRFLLVNKAKADFYGTTVERLTGCLQVDFHPRNDELKNMQADDRAVLDTKLPKRISRPANSTGRNSLHTYSDTDRTLLKPPMTLFSMRYTPTIAPSLKMR